MRVTGLLAKLFLPLALAVALAGTIFWLTIFLVVCVCDFLNLFFYYMFIEYSLQDAGNE